MAALFSFVPGILAYPFSVYLFPYVLIGSSARFPDGTRVVASLEADIWMLRLGVVASLFLFVLTGVFLWLAARSARRQV